MAPLELLPPVITGSSNISLSLSLALPSAVKVQVVLLVNSRRSSSSFNSSRVGSLLIVESSSFKMGVLSSSLVVEHMGVINLSVLSGRFAFVFTFAEGGFTVFCFIDDYFSDAANSEPPRWWFPEINQGRHQVGSIESFTTHQVVSQEYSRK